MEKDLGKFHSGTDFLFLFHLGKRKENIRSANKTYFNSKIVEICKFESTFAMQSFYLKGLWGVFYPAPSGLILKVGSILDREYLKCACQGTSG